MSGTLLLADDSITIQKVVELTFAETEHRVVAVGSGHELLERFREIAPDVVLCDVVMPDMTGYDVCQALKADPNTLHIPVILLTGTFEPFDRERAMAAGCDAIITKPFEAKELIDTVEDLLARSSAIRAAVPPGTELPISEVGIPEGVAALDFTTTGFDKMVPPPPLAPQIPEQGIELTASMAGRHEAPEAEEASVEESLPFSETTSSPAPSPAPPAEAIFSAPARLEEEPAEAPPALPAAEPAAKPFSTQPVVAPAPAVEPQPAAAAVAGNGELGLSEKDVERIASRLFELSQPMLERIAWEVIPDMAEMLVRQRIADLESEAEKES